MLSRPFHTFDVQIVLYIIFKAIRLNGFTIAFQINFHVFKKRKRFQVLINCNTIFSQKN